MTGQGRDIKGRASVGDLVSKPIAANLLGWAGAQDSQSVANILRSTMGLGVRGTEPWWVGLKTGPPCRYVFMERTALIWSRHRPLRAL